MGIRLQILLHLLVSCSLLYGTPPAKCDPKNLAALVASNGFTVDRDIRDYTNMMSGNAGPFVLDAPSELGKEVGTLGETDRWMDMGAGDLYALETFARRFSPPRKPPKLSAISYKVSRELPDDMKGLIDIHAGRFIEDIPVKELGKAKLITDVYGPLTYTSAPDVVLRRYLDLLADDGSLYIFFGPEMDYGRATVTAGPEKMTLLDWLAKNTKGITVERIENQYNAGAVRPELGSKRYDDSRDCVTLRIKKSGGKVIVPHLTITASRDGESTNPVPYRDFVPGKPPPTPKFVPVKPAHSLATKAFRLRSVAAADRAELKRAFASPGVLSTSRMPLDASTADSLANDAANAEVGGPDWKILNFAVADRKSGAVQGAVQLGRRAIHAIPEYQVQPGEKVAQLLFAFDYGADGKRLREVGKGMIGYGFGALGLTRIVTRIWPGEGPALATLTELGFKPIAGSSEYYELRAP